MLFPYKLLILATLKTPIVCDCFAVFLFGFAFRKQQHVVYSDREGSVIADYNIIYNAETFVESAENITNFVTKPSTTDQLNNVTVEIGNQIVSADEEYVVNQTDSLGTGEWSPEIWHTPWGTRISQLGSGSHTPLQSQ